MPPDTSTTRAVGFVGKIPARGDFVRQNIGEPVGAELEHWLITSVQNLYQAKAELPSGNLRFVFSAPGCAAVSVGVMAKSNDQVGRSFPLAIYTSLPVAQALPALAAVPRAYGDFFVAAEALLADLATLALEALRDRTVTLLPPSAATIEAATENVQASFSKIDGRAWLTQRFGGFPDGCEYYGLSTFCAATAPVRQAPPTSAPTVLDCPIDALGPAPWLDLAARRLAWPAACPSFVWTTSAAHDARLLLSLGFASDQLLQFVVDAKHSSARLWPLTTTSAAAIERARASSQVPLAPLFGAAPISIDEVWALASRL